MGWIPVRDFFCLFFFNYPTLLYVDQFTFKIGLYKMINNFKTILNILVPSQAPIMFTVIGTNSTTIKASWQISAGDSERGIIKGFKLLYKKKDVVGLPTTLTINGSEICTYYATGFDKNTEYEFQLLAFSHAGDGPKSAVKVTRTMDNGKDSDSNFRSSIF